MPAPIPTPPARRIVAGIPARYASTRFPGKALALLVGKPMIERVYQRAQAAASVGRVLVATDDARIVAAVEAFGGEARLTRAGHQSGTERLAEVFAGVDCDLVVNVQGDEPLLDPRAIEQALAPFQADPALQVATLKTRLRLREALMNPNVVKVTTDAAGFAREFSRAPIPPLPPGAEPDLEAHAYFKHVGLYVYTRAFLLSFAYLAASAREQAERLEQWRILENGFRIRVVETEHDSISVDTPEDLSRAEAALAVG